MDRPRAMRFTPASVPDVPDRGPILTMAIAGAAVFVVNHGRISLNLVAAVEGVFNAPVNAGC